VIFTTTFFTFEISKHLAFARLDHKTFEKCYKVTIPSYIRDAFTPQIKQNIENESWINYNATQPNPNDNLAVEAHKIPDEIHSCMLLFG
jgi:hypothetical protein